MTVSSSSGTEAINKISSGYKEKKVKEDPLGKEAFLTMLIAQLKNQDPLNPMDGTDFTAQLAQFTQLEKTMNMDSTLTQILDSMNGTDNADYVGHIGKTVTASLNSMSINDGTATDGYYTMKEAGEVVVAVYDSAGNEVKRLFLGQQNAGTNSFKWDSTDINEETVSDGDYTYDVFVVGAEGYSKLDTSVKGEVKGVSLLNGKQYLEVVPFGSTKTVLVDPSTISAVGALSSSSSGSASSSDYTGYIGKTVTGATGAVVAESGKSTKGYFTLENDQSEVVVSVQNLNGSEIRRINLGSLDSGVHEIGWDGKNSSEEDATGRFVYKILVKDSTGYSAIDPVLSGEVSGVTYRDGYPYLEIETDGSGTVEIDPASVTQIR